MKKQSLTSANARMHANDHGAHANLFTLLTDIFPFALLQIHEEVIKTAIVAVLPVILHSNSL
jgi:hypothetical protein